MNFTDGFFDGCTTSNVGIYCKFDCFIDLCVDVEAVVDVVVVVAFVVVVVLMSSP